jgi:hypothetical protein
MGEPEHISSILARVFQDLQKTINQRGGCPEDRKRETSTFPAPPTPVEAERYDEPRSKQHD